MRIGRLCRTEYFVPRRFERGRVIRFCRILRKLHDNRIGALAGDCPQLAPSEAWLPIQLGVHPTDVVHTERLRPPPSRPDLSDR